jgi:hypothetical protein
MDSTELQERITATKALITAYEAAVLAVGQGNAQSYTLDTGQTVTKVTKFDLADLTATLDILYNRCAMLEARLNGSNSFMGFPAW